MINNSTRRALVVDDNQLNSRLAQSILQRLGWQAHIVDGGSEALEALREDRFDLVLLDLRMPRMSGDEVCRAIRGELGLSDLPVVAYTAHGMSEERDRIMAHGFDDLLVKPISFADMRYVCTDIAERRRPS